MSTDEFDAKGHVCGCPGWADAWEAHWGRENLDSITLANLDHMRSTTGTTSCVTCKN